MCTSLACRKSPSSERCELRIGIGAAEGTLCDSGKVILKVNLENLRSCKENLEKKNTLNACI